MNEFLKRLSKEKGELSAKIDSLIVFLAEPYVDISEANLELLKEQLKIMQQYHIVLGKRIELNTKPQAAI